MKIVTARGGSFPGLPLAARVAGSVARGLRQPDIDAIPRPGAGQREVAVGAPQSVLAVAGGGTSILPLQVARLAASDLLPDWGKARCDANTAFCAASVGVGSLSTLGQPLPLCLATQGLARCLR